MAREQQHSKQSSMGPAHASDDATSSRLFVQNLPAYVDSTRLREHFATKGEVTDAVVIRTKDSKTSRRFGFVGYKTPEQAQVACAFFHQSFLDTCRINVRFAIQVRFKELLVSIMTWDRELTCVVVCCTYIYTC